MKTHILRFTLSSLVVILAACGQKSHEHEHDHGDGHEQTEAGHNQVLYEEVMKIHDKVMPKMEDIYKLKRELQKKIEDTPAMAAEKKKELEALIAKLDSADHSMMTWMHEFNPLPDSVAGEEKAREYLEN